MMTPETENFKTNEFIRRRKLRLQQVREQSKDIAKNIRLRAKSESLRQVVDLDAKKQKEYFERQEKLVQRLEDLYSRSLNNVGASHESATKQTQQGEIEKTVLAGNSTRPTVSTDRRSSTVSRLKIINAVIKTDISKLRGREAAAILRKKRQEILDEQKKLLDRKLRARDVANELSREKSSVVSNKLQIKTVEPNVLSDTTQKTTEPVKEHNNDVENKDDPEPITKNDIGTQWGVETMSHDGETIPSLMLPKDDEGDAQNLEQVKNKPEKSNRLDLFALSKEMPSDLRGGELNSPEIRDRIRPSLTLVTEYLQSRKLRLRETDVNHATNKHSDDISGLKQTILRSRSSKPEVASKSSSYADKSKPDNQLNRKSSVLLYNHCTKDTRDIPQNEEQLVMREIQADEDAYSQAIRESSIIHDNDSHQKKIQDVRNKVAVTKQTVEKEYRDTVNFLNSLPKERTSKVTKTAYMDEHRQQMQKENLQKKMQHEYRKIERECKKHTCLKKRRNNSKSPVKLNERDDDFEDYQYSWMPVPESDGNLAIHTIPNTVKEGKTDNTVKFSNVDSYHEYRSRHKHTPPTKDITNQEKHSSKKRVEAVVIDKDNFSDDSSSVLSESSSVENVQLNKPNKAKPSFALDQNLSDAERIIIYKILDTKNSKNCKRKTKLLSEIAKSLSSMEKVQKSATEENISKKMHSRIEQSVDKATNNSIPLGEINEGVYKVKEDSGDNISAMYSRPDGSELEPETNKRMCKQKKLSEIQKRDKGTLLQWQDGDDYETSRTSKYCRCPGSSQESETQANEKSVPTAVPSATSSISSIKTAVNNELTSTNLESGYIKLVDKTGQEAGKLFLGGSDFLKENAYEVVIQLKKKDCPKEEKSESAVKGIPKETIIENTGTEEVKSSSLDNSKKCKQRPAGRENLGIQGVLAFTSDMERESKTASPRRSQQVTETVTTNKVQDTVCQNSPTSESSFFVNSCEEKKDVTDKGTSIQYDLPSMDINPPSRPATTTYTQTTDSPIHRPVYLQMSSSTSTAYMSPPEMILPQFLKHDFDDKNIKNLDKPSKHNVNKQFKKIGHPRKTPSKKHFISNEYVDNHHQVTPPNTVRSCKNHKHDHFDINELRRGVSSTSSKNLKCHKTKCKRHHGRIDSPYTNKFKKQYHRNLNTTSDSYAEAHQLNYPARIFSPKNKIKTTKLGQLKNNSTGSLNPIIKEYINKLLSLNREGLKALEVAQQECSSVGTPGSSVINVPHNLNENTPINNKISLEHIKKVLMQQVIGEQLKKMSAYHTQINNIPNKNILPRKYRRKVLHKVKSVNITKHFSKKRNTSESKPNKLASLSTTTDDNNKIKSQKFSLSSQKAVQLNPSGSLSSRSHKEIKNNTKKITHETDVNKITARTQEKIINSSEHNIIDHNTNQYQLNKAAVTDTSPELSKASQNYYRNQPDIPINISTQTCQNMDSDYMKLAEDKLNNMEKIADLTEKCTKRLSSLAKVLEEVRKNKSLVYSHIAGSDSADSQSDHTSDKVVHPVIPTEILDVTNRLQIKSPETSQAQFKSAEALDLEVKSSEAISGDINLTVNEKDKAHSEYIPFLTDIPKPGMFKLTGSTVTRPEISHSISPLQTDITPIQYTKFRAKPPPALSRMHLKHDQECIVPHELSTVIEVDSPMSVKNKNQSSRNDILNTSNISSNYDEKPVNANKISDAFKDRKGCVNPDLLQLNREIAKRLSGSSSESPDHSKLQMLDLKHFNEIMLEPFLSIHEYAKKYNVAEPREESNNDDHRDPIINDDISSLHSDGSLPDVIAELLKRNVITEPFKFDTASNINSTTMSSESTLSMLALSNARKVKKKSSVVLKNKENIGESSDTLSISSNPDLENALQKLGMGWASSTLKKTKERLALSSSSNTSSSSLSQFKLKSIHQDIPALVTDTVSSVLLSKKVLQNKNLTDNSKSAKQQSTFTNSMTVKEFLANELANKITFTSKKSGINDTEEEFASLFVTKMPEAFKQQSQTNRDEHSNESIPSGANRARTSTPVQLYKSMTYHSSSCSNVSNGLFSNADDLSSVKMTSNSMKNHSTSDKDDLTIPGLTLKIKKNSDCSKSD